MALFSNKKTPGLTSNEDAAKREELYRKRLAEEQKNKMQSPAGQSSEQQAAEPDASSGGGDQYDDAQGGPRQIQEERDQQEEQRRQQARAKQDEAKKTGRDIVERQVEEERERKLNEEFAKRRIQERETARTGRTGLSNKGVAEAGERVGAGAARVAGGAARAAAGAAGTGGAAAAGSAAAGTAAAGGAATGILAGGGVVLLIIGALVLFFVIFVSLMAYLCNYEGSGSWAVWTANKVYGWLGGSDVCAAFQFEGSGGKNQVAGNAQVCDINTLQRLAQQNNEPYPAARAPELVTLMDVCIPGRVPAASGVTTYTYDQDHMSCNFSRGNSQQCDSDCSHAVNSCHYGGAGGNLGALAADYAIVGGVGDQIIAAAMACGAKDARCENSSGTAVSCSASGATHVHVTSASCDRN